MTTPTRKTGRSPSYPAIPLDQAIARARTLYERESRNAVPISLIQEHWGYRPGTGPANTTLAAVKKFGLLADEGSGDLRTGRLTELALEILLNPEPEEAIRRAALTPKIHRELLAAYQESGLPSDAALRYELIRNREFTETGAGEFIAQFRKTLNFAQLAAADSLPPAPPEPTEGAAAMPTAPPAQAQRPPAAWYGGGPAASAPSSASAIPIRLPGGETVQLVAQWPITAAEWDHLLRVMDVMKPGLVEEPGPYGAADYENDE